MKRGILAGTLLAAALLLTACAGPDQGETGITATVLNGEHYRIEVHAVTVEPGGTASFLIQPESGYKITAADYAGEYTLTEAHGRTRLELADVRYPVRITLTTSHYAREICYKANGGEALTGAGLTVSRSYDVTNHIRPNVSIGTDLFARDGYTMTGWNTEPDGSGQRVGLGSRMTVEDSATLYAQWAAWTDPACFAWRETETGAEITGYAGETKTLVIPERLDGHPVTGIAAGAFAECAAEEVILPKSLVRVETGAFTGAALRELAFFDNIEYITDGCFDGCGELATLRISAIEDPYGYSFRRESLLADKLDLLISTAGEKRIVFYGGCSMWYNLTGPETAEWAEGRYTVLNMGLNGMADSLIQMELLRLLMTDRDILVHAPEISSPQQMLTDTAMGKNDDKIWCALEYNYDLAALVDIRVFDGGVLESLRVYLDKKKPGGTYMDLYRDSKGYDYYDPTGCIPYIRTQRAETLADQVSLDPESLDDVSRLEEEYGFFTAKGIPVYVSHTCVNIDRVPEEQRENTELIDTLFREKFSAMAGVTVISGIGDFIYHDEDCYDTVYHLLTEPARNCTRIWLRDLQAALERDGRWDP